MTETIKIDLTEHFKELLKKVKLDVYIRPISDIDCGDRAEIKPSADNNVTFFNIGCDWDGSAHPIIIKDNVEYQADMYLSVDDKAIYISEYRAYIPYTKAMELIPELSRTNCMWYNK